MTQPTPVDDEDPVVREVRRWRAEVVAQAGGSLKGLLKLLSAESSRGRRQGKAAREATRPNRSRKRRKAG